MNECLIEEKAEGQKYLPNNVHISGASKILFGSHINRWWPDTVYGPVAFEIPNGTCRKARG